MAFEKYTEDQLIRGMRKAHRAGDFNAAKRLASAVKEKRAAFTQKASQYGAAIGRAIPPLGPMGEIVGGQVGRFIGEYRGGIPEVAATMATGAVAEPLAGLAGIAQAVNPFAEEGAGARAVAGTREALTRQPTGRRGQRLLKDIGEATAFVGEKFGQAEQFLGDVAYEHPVVAGAFMGGGLGGALLGATERGPEIMGAAAKTVPTGILAALDLIGIKGLQTLRGKRGVTGIDDKTINQLNETGVDIDDLSDEGIRRLQKQTQANAEKAQAPPESKPISDIITDLKQQNEVNLVARALPDEVILEAADSLGLDLNPDHYSNSFDFRASMQALKSSRPDTELAKNEIRQIEALGERADTLVNDMTGVTDKSILDTNIKDKFASIIKDLEDQSDAAFARVDEVFKQGETAMKDFGGFSSSIRTMYVTRPDHSRIYLNDRINKLGGRQDLLEKPERDILSLTQENPTWYALDQIRREVGRGYQSGIGKYRETDRTLLDIIYSTLLKDQQGMADAYGVGPDFAQYRKQISDRKQIEKESVQLFGREVRDSIIPKLSQAAVALTKGDVTKLQKMLDALPGDVQRTEVVATMLNDLFTFGGRKKDLGAGFMTAFKALNETHKGAKKLLFKHLPEGAEERFDKIGHAATGIFRAKSLENTSRTAMARNLFTELDRGTWLNRIYLSTRHIAYLRIGSPNFGRMLKKISGKPQTVRADEFVTSQEFKRAMRKGLEGDPVEAQNILNKSPAYKAWLTTTADAAEIAAIGFLPWLVKVETEESGRTQQ